MLKELLKSANGIVHPTTIFNLYRIILTLNFFMKKLFLSALAVFFVFLSQAQITKGTTFIGGGVSFGNSSSTGGDTSNYYANPRSSSFNISPSISWAVKDNLVFGVSLGYGHSKSDYESPKGPINKLNTYSGGIFLRKYQPVGKGFNLFLQSNLNFVYSKTTYSADQQSESTSTTWGPSLGLAPGVAYRLGRHWQAEAMLPGLASLYYNHTSSSQKNPGIPDYRPVTNNFGVSTSVSNLTQFTLGILYNI